VYLWAVLIYTGKDARIESSLITANMNKTTAILIKLTAPLLKQGQTVWMDNYNSPIPERSLKKTYQTDYIGMLKLKRKNVSMKVKDTKLKKEGMIAKHSDPFPVVKRSDKKM
jgi:hypothetical protein